MKLSVFLLFVSFCITSIYSLKWEDCGIPLTRKIYFQNVVVSPSKIKIIDSSYDHSISINVAADIQNYELGAESKVSTYIQLFKENDLYVDTSVGDLCDILAQENSVECPLSAGRYSFIYKYLLPPLPTGNYTLRLSFKEDISGKEIGCLSTQNQVIGLGLDACSYDTGFSAVFKGSTFFDKDNTVIQVGPRGYSGIDTGKAWGIFSSITASPDLVGYNFKVDDHYVWGLSGNLTGENTFSGTVVIGYRPDVTSPENAELIYQGVFNWKMTPNPEGSPAYLFQTGTFSFVPAYYYPSSFPYPLNIGNLGNFTISISTDGNYFTVASSKKWCRCNCIEGGSGKDDLMQDGNKSEKGMSGFRKATIAVAVVGFVFIVAAVLLIVRLRRSKPRPVVYDEADLMDPQKPDYGTMAINEAFEAEDQEYN